MTEPTPTEATPAMRRKADLMVGLFVGAIVFLLGGAVVLATSSMGLGVGLLVVGLLVGVGGLLVLRSIGPEDRARLTAPKQEPTDGV
jgi:F0F1-type ATP synthase assembly protein I